MNITHVTFGFTTGGAELMMSDIMAEQACAGHNMTLLLINDRYEEEIMASLDNRITVVKLGRPASSHNPLWLLRYNIALNRTRPDIVHFHQSKAPYITIRRPHVRYVATVHDTGISLRPKRGLDQVFAISDAVNDDLMRRFGIQSATVPNGIATKAIATKNPDIKPPTKPAPFRIVTVARLLHEKKGQDIAIKAIRNLRQTGSYQAVTLDIIGEGPSELYLENLAAELGVDDAVNFLGNRPRSYIYGTLKDYDLFILPSRYEGFGLTVAEAMAAKVPVLVSDIEGPMEIIAGGRFGHHFACGDPDDCARKIADIICDYPRALGVAANEAFRHVTANYDIARTAQEYLRHYASILPQ